jgi:superfamily II DNA/RNA helicase
LSGAVDVVVSSPTKLLQHIKDGHIYLRDVRWLVSGRMSRAHTATYEWEYQINGWMRECLTERIAFSMCYTGEGMDPHAVLVGISCECL